MSLQRPSARDGLAALVIDAYDVERIGCSLVVNAEGRVGPTADAFSAAKDMFGAFVRLARELFDARQDAGRELHCGGRVAGGEVVDGVPDVLEGLGRPDDIQRRAR